MNVTKANIPSYLKKHGLISGKERLEIIPIPSIVNHVFRIETPGRSLILKQVGGTLAHIPDIELSPRRIQTEYDAITLWHRLCLGSDLEESIPEICHYDQKNHLIIFNAASNGAISLTSELLAVVVKRAVARKLAKLLATVHSKTFLNNNLRRKFSDYGPLEGIKLGLFHVPMHAAEHGSVQKAVQGLMRRTLENKMALIHADTNPKNILVAGNKVIIIDYEFSCFGDPAYDVGCLLAHYFLSGLIHYSHRKKYFQAMETFWRIYEKYATFPYTPSHKRNTIQHIGPIIWGRTFGKVKVPFLPKKLKRCILVISRKIVTGKYKNLDGVFKLAEEYGKDLGTLIDVEKIKKEVSF